MSEQTEIAWCDSTLNPWRGCTKVSPGCANCYAEALSNRFGLGKYQRGVPRIKSKSFVKNALRYNKTPWICDECGIARESVIDEVIYKRDGQLKVCNHRNFHRRRIFSLSLGDWLDEEVPIEWLAEMLDTIRKCDQVTWILCTKRPENFKERIARAVIHLTTLFCTEERYTTVHWLSGWESGNRIPKNIILLASVENQEQADKRIPELLRIPAACRGLSLEPLLGPVDLTKLDVDERCPECKKAITADVFSQSAHCDCCVEGDESIAWGELKWLIIGGESGPNSRSCNVDWIKSLVAQGRDAGVATFVKQLGTDPRGLILDDDKHGFPLKLKDKKGGNPSEWSIDLRVQEYPVL
jgi:protein gp37